MTTSRRVYRLPGDAFSGTVCRGLPALRAPAQAECRQPAQLNARLIPAYYSVYRPRKDERLSWPSWLTCSGWLTHISGHLSAADRAQDRESSPARDRRSTTEPRHQQRVTYSLLYKLTVYCFVNFVVTWLNRCTMGRQSVGHWSRPVTHCLLWEGGVGLLGRSFSASRVDCWR